ncbi:peptide deformylase, partial [Pseudomonadota bacterium]
MSVREVLKMGDPLLYQRSVEVTEFDGKDLAKVLEDMFDTMEALDGVGLAAPQIGIPLRIVIFSVGQNPRYPDAESVPRTILINPIIEPQSVDLETGWEGCLSVPGMRGLVERHSSIIYSGYDETQRPIKREATGFHSRVVQHEVDHLDGIVYPMRIKDIRNFGYESVLFDRDSDPQ